MTVVAALFWAAFIVRSSFLLEGRRFFVLFDDAMISMRYARNLADGHGLTWNTSGDRVEGITNPLWAAWMAVLHLLPVDAAKQPLLVMLSSAAALVATFWVVRQLTHVVTGDRRAVLVAVVLTAGSYPLAFWALRGMEVGVLALLITFATLCAVRTDPALMTTVPRWNRAALAAAGVAAVGVRLDAAAPVALIMLYALWRSPATERRRAVIVLGGSLAGALLIFTLARVAYYGDLLPNTYYLKATGLPLSSRLDAGWDALSKVTVVHLGALLLVAGFGVVSARRQPALLLLGVFLVQAAYSVWAGGDAWEVTSFANRYLSVGLPLLAVLGGSGVVSLIGGDGASMRLGVCSLVAAVLVVLAVRYGARTQLTGAGITYLEELRPALFGVAALLAIAAALLIWRRPVMIPAKVAIGVTMVVLVATNAQSLQVWWRHNAFGRDVEVSEAREAILLRQATDPDAVIAVWLAGTIPYFSELPAVDLLGKSDRHIARLPVPADEVFRPGHNKRDLTYSLRTYRPDIVQFVPFLGEEGMNTLRQEGYDLVNLGRSNMVHVRRSSDRVDQRILVEGLPEPG